MPQQRIVDDFQEDDFLPDDFEIEPTRQVTPPRRNALQRGWDFLNTAPLAGAARNFSRRITDPSLDRDIPILGGISNAVRGFIGGAAEGTADLLTPLNVADAATGFGKGTLVRGANRAISALTMAGGAQDIADGKTAQGIAEVAGGALGFRPGTKPTPTVNQVAPKPTLRLNAGPAPVRAPHRGTSLGGMTPEGYLHNSGEIVPIQSRDIPTLDAEIIRPESRMLPAGPEPRLALPAVGETSAPAPRFYQGKLGVADAEMNYPNPLPGARNPGGSPLDYPESLGTIDAPTAAERGLGTVFPLRETDKIMRDPVFGALIPESMKYQAVPTPVPATAMRPDYAAPGRIDGETGEMGVAKLTKRAFAKQKRELKRGEIPSTRPNVKLHGPAGGRILERPTPTAKELPYDPNRFEVPRGVRSSDNMIEGQVVDPITAKPHDPNKFDVTNRVLSDYATKPVKPETPYDPNRFNANRVVTPTSEVIPPATAVKPKLSRTDKKAAAKATKQAQINADLASRPVNPRDRLITALTDAQPLSRAERKTFGGEFKPLQLDETNVKDLLNTIKVSDKLTETERRYAMGGISKVLNSKAGSIPNDTELHVLGRVFGSEFTNLVRSRMTIASKAKNIIIESVNLPRAIMASTDFSAPFRQGLPLIHKKAFWTSFDDMFKAGWDEKQFKAIQDDIQADPNFAAAEKAGLDITDLDGLTNREEAARSTWSEKIPVFGRVSRGSNRAYTTFLNKTRMDTFNDLITKTKYSGADTRDQEVIANQIARFVNTATGRGSLEDLKLAGTVMNATLFSPKLQASRVGLFFRALGSVTGYTNMPKELRFEALKSLFSVVGVGSTLGVLANEASKLTGSDVEVVTDSNNSDFGKIKIGDTRIDPYAGFQQYAVLADRLLKNQSTSPTTGNVTKFGTGFADRTRGDLLLQFGYNKAHPALTFAINLATGVGSDNRPIKIENEIAQRAIPIILQDLYELQQQDPKLLPLIIPAAFGMGVQNFGKDRDRP